MMNDELPKETPDIVRRFLERGREQNLKADNEQFEWAKRFIRLRAGIASGDPNIIAEATAERIASLKGLVGDLLAEGFGTSGSV